MQFSKLTFDYCKLGTYYNMYVQELLIIEMPLL